MEAAWSGSSHGPNPATVYVQWCNTWPAVQVHACIPIDNEPFLLGLLYKQLCPGREESGAGVGATRGTEAEPKAQMEMGFLLADCRRRCDSNTWPTAIRIKLVMSPFLPPTFCCRYLVSLNSKWTCPGLQPTGKTPIHVNFLYVHN